MLTNPDAAFVTSLMINIVICTFANVTPFYLMSLGYTFFLDAGLAKLLFFLVPHYCFGDGMIAIEVLYYTEHGHKLPGYEVASAKIFDSNEPLDAISLLWFKMINLFFMLIHGILIAFLIIGLEKSVFKKLCRRKQVHTTPSLDGGEEGSDIEFERHNLFLKEVLLDKGNVLVNNLSKTFGHSFGNKPSSVDDITFAVSKGECFGIVGLQNSGKSVILLVLAGLEKFNFGEIRILGLNLKKDVKKIRPYIGYCPSTVNLSPYLTPKEYLEYFCCLKYIPKKLVKQSIEFCLLKMNLTKLANTVVGKLSVSDRKKLCIAIAILGKPPVLLLDEPSRGMNLMAKKHLFLLLKLLKAEGHIIILSSGSITVCEAVCNRFALIVNGRFKFTGTGDYLRKKYGGGYNLNVHITELFEKNTLKVKHFIHKHLPSSRLVEETSKNLHYHISKESLFDAFIVVERGLAKNMFSDYLVTKTKLHDIFMKAVLDQYVEEQESEETENVVTKKNLIQAVGGCCTYFLCLKFFSSPNLLYEESDEDLDKSDDNETDVASTSEEEDGFKKFWSKLLGH